MDLREEMDRHAHRQLAGGSSRLSGDDVRARIARRVARGRRAQNAKAGVGALAVAGAVGAVGFVGAKALRADGPAAPSASPTPAPTATESAPPSVAPTWAPVPTELPALGTDGYLATGSQVWQPGGPVECDALAGRAPSNAEFFDVEGQQLPFPSWIETGRLYGWGDDVLVGGYPIPIASIADGAVFAQRDALVADFNAGPAQVTLTGKDGGFWGFDVRWFELGDPERDAPGWFIELTPNWGCGADGLVSEGQYGAQMSYVAGDGSVQVVSFGPVTVVRGVPSMPEVDAQG